MKILAIETSCDETAIAILEAKGGLSAPKFKILSNIVSSQIKIHAPWGGVVPNLAKREHQKNIVHVLMQALTEAKILENHKLQNTNHKQITNSKFKIPNSNIQHLTSILEREPELLEIFLTEIPKIKIPKIDAIAVTVGPGLEPALWVGINFARALSLAWDKPLIPVNHMEGHIVSSLLSQTEKSMKHEARSTKSGFGFPAVALLVSGGHTELVLIKNWLKYKIIGQTRDDATGEAFDKVAKMLGLEYPGGPAVSQQAEKRKSEIRNPKSEICLPRPMIDSDNYDFSFSGLKTAVLYKLKELSAVSRQPSEAESRKLTAEVCYEFQQAVIDVLISKTIRATKEYKVKTVIVGGGVIANKELRAQLSHQLSALSPQIKLLMPDIKFTGDNAAMIAGASYLHATKKQFVKNINKLKADGNMILK